MPETHRYWKCLREAGRDQLFDIARDPGESRDLSASHRSLAENLYHRTMGDWPAAGAKD
jgi:hypothetical protein